MNIMEQVVIFIEKYDSVVLSYVIHIIFAVLILLIGRFLSRFFAKQVRNILINQDVEPTVVKFVSSLTRYIIVGLTFVAVLGQLGVQTASIVAVIGAMGLAVGLALQGSLSNFAAGVLLILFRPFKVGETVIINNINGNVVSIQIFSTTLLTPTGEEVTIPNSQVLSTSIINYSRYPERRIDLIIGVDYNANIQLVYQLLNSAIAQTPNILNTRKSVVSLTDLAPSSINFTVQAWVNNSAYSSARTALLENITQIFRENNINLPYPTMDINISKA